jgi:hypothetical protein
MAREVGFVVKFSPTDRYRRRHLSSKGRILKFVAQYETKIGGKWYPVVRYDTAHGYFHKDLMHFNQQSEKIRLEEKGFNDALNSAEKDIKANWQKYKDHFIREINQL